MTKTKLKTEKNNHSYFYSLELEGINCFKEKQILDLSNGENNYSSWTIILGDNGTGKTTLLKLLDRVQPSDVEIDFSRQNIKVDKNYYFSKYSFNGIDNELIAIKVEDLGKCNLTILRKNIKEEISIGKFQEGKNLFFDENQRDMFVLSYGASRRMSKNQNLQTSIRNYTNSLFDDSIELINAEEWFLQKEWAVLKSSRSSKLKFEHEFNLVKNLLIDILPDVTDMHSRTIDEKISKPSIEVKTSFGWVNIRKLSFGYQTLTALIVDIAANLMEKYPDSKNPLLEPVIILIDEIDLHLHPKWQREVLDKFSSYFPNAQFVVTAHSPLIAQAAQDINANIVVCRKEENKIVIDNNPDSVKGWRIDQILTSDLFEVESPRSKITQEMVDEYTILKGKEKLTKKEKEKFELLTPNIEKAYPNKTSELDEKLTKFAEKYLK